MNIANPYTVEISLEPLEPHPGENTREQRRFHLILIDREEESQRVGVGEHSDFHKSGVVFLQLDQPLPGREAHHRTARRFLDDFLAGEPTKKAEGLAFGRWLLDRLLEPEGVRPLWERIQVRRGEDRPIEIRLVLPPNQLTPVDDLPFEMLADDKGFLLRRRCAGGYHSLTRSVRNLTRESYDLAGGDRTLLAWANPRSQDADVIPDALLDAHEKVQHDATKRLGLQPLEPCRNASRRSLEARLQESRPVPLLTLLAHGPRGGGGVLLHDEKHRHYPLDEGVEVSASDLAVLVRSGGVKAALLWTCHSGTRHRENGSVAEALLDPDRGGLVAAMAFP